MRHRLWTKKGCMLREIPPPNPEISSFKVEFKHAYLFLLNEMHFQKKYRKYK